MADQPTLIKERLPYLDNLQLGAGSHAALLDRLIEVGTDTVEASGETVS